MFLYAPAHNTLRRAIKDLDQQMTSFQVRQLVRQNLALSCRLQTYKKDSQVLKARQKMLYQYLCDILAKIYEELNNITPQSVQIQTWVSNLQAIFGKKMNELGDLLKIIDSIFQKQAEQSMKRGQLIQEKSIIRQKLQLLSKDQKIQRYEAEVALLTRENMLLKQRIVLLQQYESSSIDRVIEGQHLCYCGGIKLNFSKEQMEEQRKTAVVLKPEASTIKQQHAVDKNQGEKQAGQGNDINSEAYKAVLDRLLHCQTKLKNLKLKNKFPLEQIIASQPFQLLKAQYKSLMIFNSQLITKLKKHYDHLKLIQVERINQIQQLTNEKKNQYIDKLTATKDTILQKTDIGECLASIYQALNGCIRDMDKVKADDQYPDCMKEEVTIEYKKFMGFLLGIFQRQQFYQFFEANKISYASIHDKLHRFRQQYCTLIDSARFFHNKFKNSEKELSMKRSLKKQSPGLRNEAQKSPLQQMLEIKGMITEIEKKLIKIQFSSTELRVNEAFNRAKDERIRKSLEFQLQFWKQKQQMLKQTVEGRLNLQSVIECRQMEYKLEEGKHLALIQLLKKEVDNLNQKNTYLDSELDKLTKERTILRIERQASKATGQNNALLNDLKHELEYYKQKIVCGCNKENLAKVLLSECRHLICSACFQSSINSRKRTCPLCNAKFIEKVPIEIKFN